MFVATNVGKEMGNEDYDAMTQEEKKKEKKKQEEEKSLIVEHNEDVFNIYFECVVKQDNNIVTIVTKRED